MQTDQRGVFVAGDGAGVAGVLTAQRQGLVAGLYAAAKAGVISERNAEAAAVSLGRQLRSIGRFRRAMDHMYPVYAALYGNISDDTIICRCEGVTAGALRRAIREGTPDLSDIKKRTRTGMGYCQGANCSPTIAAILIREFGLPPEEILMATSRPPSAPLPLSLLMVDTEPK
jgi:NAD(P)H-nitrite reductase large subunit